MSAISSQLQHEAELIRLIDQAEQLVLVHEPGQLAVALELADEVLLVPELAKGLQLAVGESFMWSKLKQILV